MVNETKLEAKLAWRSPSNIAIIKYWGKHGVQLPRNPSISFTLDKAFTETSLTFSQKGFGANRDEISLDFLFENAPNEAFRLKQLKFLRSILPIFPFLTNYNLSVSSHNSFPHSAGIASSASSMSALALCLCEMELIISQIPIFNSDLLKSDPVSPHVIDFRSSDDIIKTLESKFEAISIIRQTPEFIKRASEIARLGSGSACRSLFPTMAAWGVCPEIEGSNDEYAVGFESDIHPVFKTYHDAILIASRGEKSVSSRMGHGLMDNNPFAAPRYQQANERMTAVVAALRSGDVHAFGQIAEDEAMSLHALMMTSSPSFTLLKPNTLRMIEILRTWREATKLPAYFTLDAGPNLHLLYPNSIKSEVNTLINNELKPLCEDDMVIFDKVGKGATRLNF